MGRLLSLVRQDMVVAYRSRFPHAVLVVALLFIALIVWVVPKDMNHDSSVMHLDQTMNREVAPWLLQNGVPAEDLAVDDASLMEAVEDRQQTGVLWEGSLENPQITIFYPGLQSDSSMMVMEAALESLVRSARGDIPMDTYELVQLRPAAEKVPFNRSMVPLVIAFDVVLLGFMFAAVMVFQEKQEGSIRAFRITPGRPLEYMAAKSSVNILLGLLYTLLLTVAVTGIPERLTLLLAVVFLASLLMTLTGLLLSVFFNNLSEFLFVAVFISAIFTLPMVSYFQPSFAPSYLQVIPSYPVLFGLREIFFPTGNDWLISAVIRTLFAETAIMAAAAYVAVQRRLMKEGF